MGEEYDRFGLDGLDIEKLQALLEECQQELSDDLDLLEDPDTNSELKSELRNSDIPYLSDKLEAIQKAISKKEKGRSR